MRYFFNSLLNLILISINEEYIKRDKNYYCPILFNLIYSIIIILKLYYLRSNLGFCSENFTAA